MEDQEIKYWLMNVGAGVVFLFIFTLGFLVLPVLSAVISSSIFPIALITALTAAAGFGYVKVFQGYSPNRILGLAASGSLVISLIASLQKIMIDGLRELDNSFNSVQGSTVNNGMEGYLSVSSEPVIQPLTFFALMMFAFNSPLLREWYRSSKKDPKFLGLYAIPLLVYIVVPAVFGG
jgi:hypothetical protein